MSKVLDLISVLSKSGTSKAQANTGATPAATDNSNHLATTSWAYSAMTYIAQAAGFNIQLGVTGFIKLPSWLGGLILQWGKENAVASGGGANVTFPLTFPNACLSNGATINNTVGNSTALSAGVGTPSVSGMTVFHNGTNPATAITWYAIGY